jgi:micrococcal nuclease
MSRRQKNAAIVAFFFFALIVVAVDHYFGDGARQVIERATYTSIDRQTYHGKTFAVVNVVDGDTIDIDVPDGDEAFTRIRLIGVDTPETKHPTVGKMYYGPEATDFTAGRCSGKRVTLLLDTVGDQRGYYGRLLAYVQLEDGAILNAELIRTGHGYAYLSYPHSEFDHFQKLMNEAIEQKAGLWENATRDDLPKWLKRKRPDLLRYPQDN